MSRLTVGAYERPLSLRMMTARRWLWPRLFRASNAMPPVIDPSPMMATTVRWSSPRRSSAVRRPCSHDSEVEAWLFSTMSWADSLRLG